MFELPDDEILPLSKKHVFYTWSAQAEVNPIPVKRAKGVYFWDTNDKRYLDFNSMTMCVNVGHGEERIIKAMQEQVAELPYAAPGMTTRIRALGSKAVADVTPHQALTKVLFTLGGADANENAIKLARGYSERPAQDPYPLSLLSRCDHGRDGSYRGSPPPYVGTVDHVRCGAFSGSVPVSFHLSPR